MATPTEPARKQRIVLCLSHNGIFKRVAVPFDKDLGSPEISAEVARAFGIAATSIESLTMKEMPSPQTSGRELPVSNLPLNLNGHDLEHKFNHSLHSLLFGERFYLDVKFNTVPGRRPSASEDPVEAFGGLQIEGQRPFVFGKPEAGFAGFK